jgi:hypothetical protein
MFCRSLFVLLYFLFCPFCCLFFFNIPILITPLVSSNFWPLLSVLLQYTDSDYPFGILNCLSIVLSVTLQYTDSDYPFGIFKLLSIMLSVLLQYTDSDYLPLVSSNSSLKVAFSGMLCELTPTCNQHHLIIV